MDRWVAAIALLSGCTFGTMGASGGPDGLPMSGSGDDDGAVTVATKDDGVASSGGVSAGKDADTTIDPDPTTTAPTTSDDATTSGSSAGDTASSDDLPPTPEICDGIDNDGDGGIDEGSRTNAACNGCVFLLANTGDWYFAVCSMPATWDEARIACTSFGPDLDLAIIDDAIDQAALLGLAAAGDHWIGLSDIAEEGHWQWVDGSDAIVDGSVVGYDGWAATQPSGGLVENCAELDPGQLGWADSPCRQAQSYVCGHPA